MLNFQTKFDVDAFHQLFDSSGFAKKFLHQIFHVHETSETSFINLLLYVAPKLDFKRVEASEFGKPKVRYSLFC